MFWYVYIIECNDQSLYTGVTNDLDKRLRAHRQGKGSKIVRSKLPVKFMYKETFKSKSTALKREAEIKTWPRSKKLNLIQ